MSRSLTSLAVRGVTIFPLESERCKAVAIPATELSANKLLRRMEKLLAEEYALPKIFIKMLQPLIGKAVDDMRKIKEEQNGIARALYVYRDRVAWRKNKTIKILRLKEGALRQQLGRVRVEVVRSDKAAVAELIRKGLERYVRTVCEKKPAKSRIATDRKKISTFNLREISVSQSDVFSILLHRSGSKFSIPEPAVLKLLKKKRSKK